MKKIFEQLIIDFHDSELPDPNMREFKLPHLPEHVRKAFVFMGMRRSGKTWAMYQQMRSLFKSAIRKEQVLYINFQDDRLISVKSKDLQAILDAYFSLYPQYINRKDLHFFFDEIHEVDGWDKFIRRLLDQEKMQIYVSGSSAKMLSKEISSVLRGRTVEQEIFPYSFKEYLTGRNIEYGARYTKKQKAVVSNAMGRFLLYGGFPESVALDEKFHRELLQNYIEVVIYRDIVERHNIKSVNIVREFLVYCLQNSSSYLSINKVFHRFKSQGKSLGKNLLYECLGYFTDSYCLFTVPLFSHSLNKQNINPKKIYAVDQGLISAYTIKPDFEKAACLENTVFNNLRRQHKGIFYYKTGNGKEVDFLTVTTEGKKELYQACMSLSDEMTAKREISALNEAMKELKLKTSTLITADDEDKIEAPNGTINCFPVWKWLLL